MEWRKNRTSGSSFMGCMKWPKCNGTRNEHGVDSRISAHVQTRLHRLLIAAALNSEDDCLTFTSAQLAEVDNYELHIDEVSEDKSFIVTVRRKG